MALSRSAFNVGLQKVAVRFKLPKPEVLEAYYKWLERRLDDDQFLVACSDVFASASRFPRPIDFMKAAPAATGSGSYTVRRARDPFEPVVVYVRKGTREFYEWQEVLERRRQAGTVIPLENRDGYPAPVLRIVD